jgi:hypothetical protein
MEHGRIMSERVTPDTIYSASVDRDEERGPRRGRQRSSKAQRTSCRASATSTESPSWFRTSSPDSGTSPEVDCDTMIFLAINPRQVICEELA